MKTRLFFQKLLHLRNGIHIKTVEDRAIITVWSIAFDSKPCLFQQNAG